MNKEAKGSVIILDRSEWDGLVLHHKKSGEIVAERVRKDGAWWWCSDNPETQAILDVWQSGSTGEALASILSESLKGC